MSVLESEAIEAARTFIETRDVRSWNEHTIEIYADEIEGRKTWVIKASDATPAREDAWMHPVWQPVLYFVDRETGKLFGFATERSKTIFSHA